MSDAIPFSETQSEYRFIQVPVVFTAPILVGHRLPWDVPGFWEDKPLNIAERKDKLAMLTEEQRTLLTSKKIVLNGVLTADAEAYLRAHWLPDGRPGFPVEGFMGAIRAGVVQHKGKGRDSLSATKVKAALAIFGDESAAALVAFEAPAFRITQEIGTNSGIGAAPRLITRLEFALGTRAKLRCRIVPSLISEQQVAQVIAWGGDFGIGQRRPGSPKGGTFGTWRIDTSETAK